MAGRVIYKKRKHLDGFLNPLKENPFNLVITEVEIIREERSMEQTSKGCLVPDNGFQEYSVDVNAHNPNRYDQPLRAILQMRSLSKQVAENETNVEAWLYARSAFLYYIACFIIWVRPPIFSLTLYPLTFSYRHLQLSAGFTFTSIPITLPLATIMPPCSLSPCLEHLIVSSIVSPPRRHAETFIGIYEMVHGHGIVLKTSTGGGALSLG